MLLSRRNFAGSIGFISALSFLKPELLNSNDITSNQNNLKINQSEEDFWAWVQNSYTVNPNIINLNNGGVSPSPKVVQDALDTYNKICNEGPSYFMWRILDQGRETVRAKIAELAGCYQDEISICRNTTEALDTIIFGLNLGKGDEIILAKQDYPNVINAWKQREKRDGIVIKWVNLELPSENDDYLLEQFKSAFTSKTKIINLTHIINWNGQILPVKKIAKAAHEKGIEVMVDAAHTFAHLDYKISDLDCDYFGTSLHKWLSAPLGSGMLWIKKEKIKNIWPLYPNADPLSQDIRKFESLGTRSFPIEQAIGDAVNFHNSIGSKRKEARMRFLKNYWAEPASKIDRIKIQTPLKDNFSCGLCLFSVDGMKPADVSNFLFDKFKIHTVSIEWENISGVRVTPHVYTRLKDLDRLLEGIHALSKS